MTVIFRTICSNMGEAMQPAKKTSQPRGRPRNLKPEQALDAAMRVFWAEGYHAASVDRLCRATRMPRASLYQQYGDKEGLFLASIAYYVETQIGPVAQALGPVGTLKDDLTAFFDEVVGLATRDCKTPGCLVSCVLVDAAGANKSFQEELDRRFSALEDRILRRLAQDDSSADMEDLRALAGMLAAVARGIMLRARSGAAAADLAKITRVTIRRVVLSGR